MKKTMKKWTALTLTGAMAMSLAACGGGGGNAGTQAPGTTAAGTTAAEAAAAGGETTAAETSAPAGGTDKPTITFMTTQFYGSELANDHSEEVIKRYEEYTNTHVEWKWEANDTYKDKLGLTLMDKDNMPMVITTSGVPTANIIDAAKKGAFWDLTPFLQDQESFPNLSKANENVLKSITVDGQVIGVYRAREIGRIGFSYRTDWAEAVGITKDPETPEEVYDMMYKFTYNDPDGNGKDDTYGLELTKYVGPLDTIQTWFGVGNEWAEKDGRLVPVHQTAEYREALTWMRKMYEDGLVRADWATVDSGTFGDACKKGEAGVFIDVMDSAKRIWNYYNLNEVKSVVDESKNATMTLVGPINNVTLATSGHNGLYLITKSGAKTEQDVRNCLHFLDKMCDDEMMILADYGLEGVTYDIDADGYIVLRNELEVSQTPQVGLNQSIPYIPHLSSQSITLKKDEPTLAQDASYERNRPLAIYNPALGYLANSEVNSEVGTDIEQIIDDARTQYICGQIDEAGLDSADQQWLGRGGDRLVEEVNQLYQADPNK